MRRRPNFSITAAVVLILVLFAFAANFVRPLIPTPTPNAITSYPGDYLKLASAQPIEWHPLEPSSFAEARRLDRPILMVIGVSWSQNAREFDDEIFDTADIQNYLNHNYYCIRVDAAEMPAWATCYLPLSRVAAGIRPRFQIWILEPNGDLMDNVSRRRAETHLDSNQVLDELIRARHLYTDLRQSGRDADFAAQQRQDVSEIEAPGNSASLSFQAINSSIQSAADDVNGGLPQNGFQDLQPFAWSYLAQTGQDILLRRSLLPVLRAPIVDVLNGGFFVASRQTDWQLIEYDKVALKEADMAIALAQMRPYLTDPSDQMLCDFVRKSTTDSLTTEFVDKNGYIVAARIGDDQDDERSLHSSITPSQMRNTLDTDEREAVRKHLGLRVETNAQMLPFLADRDSIGVARSIRDKLRKGLPTSQFSSGEFMDVNASIAARLMQIGRITKDQKLIDFGSSLFDKLDQARLGDLVPHDLDQTGKSQAYLGDFLAFADAALQDYLSSGRVVSFRDGLSVLQRALLQFAGPNTGEFWMTTPPSSDLVPATSATVQIADDFGESTSAKVMRLCTEYGRLLLGNTSESNDGVQLLRTAYATESLLSQQASAIGMAASSFACSALELNCEEYALVVGPDSVQVANDLYSKRPTRFVAPVSSPYRPDLSEKSPGIYIVRRGAPKGPYSLDQAETLLNLATSPGP